MGMMAAALLAAAWLAGAMVNGQQRTIQLRPTYRDFLPSACLRRSEYSKAWGTAANRAIPDNLFLLDDPGDATVTDEQFAGRISKYCPDWSEFKAGTLSGHPDFQAHVDDSASGSSCVVGCQGEGRTIELTIKPQMVSASSGLPKVVYCRDGDEARCGRELGGTKYSTTRGKYFKSWFNDDPKYNKRVGIPLIATEIDKGSGIFKFNSRWSSDPSCPGLGDEVGMCFNPLGPLLESIDFAASSSVRSAPLFPVPNTDMWRGKKFLFTTELHTYFEFQGTSDVLNFEGDDDLWVFINGTLVIDLGGQHNAIQGNVALTDLGLEPGEVYTLDIFHAERHLDGSYFKLSTTSVTTSCNVVQFGSVAFDVASATSDDFERAQEAFLDDDLTITLVSQSSPPNTPSFAYLHQQHNVGTGFFASFDFEASPDAEGFAFVLHNREKGLDDLPESAGEHLNFKYIENSIAVVFDLCRDRYTTGLCEEQRVAIHFQQDKTKEDYNSASNDTLGVYDTVYQSLKLDGSKHSVRIEYLETPDWIEVYLDDSLFLRQSGVRVENITGGRNAYLGFTTSSGSRPSSIKISGLRVETVSVDPSKTEAVDLFPNATSKTIPADGESKAGFSIQTKDLCLNLIQYGGFADYGSAVFVERLPSSGEVVGRGLQSLSYYNGSLEPLVIPAEIEDRGDGTYAAVLRSTVPTSFSLYMCFAQDGCNLNMTKTPVDDPELAADGLMQVIVEAGDPRDFFSFVTNAVAVYSVPTLTPTVTPTATPTLAPSSEAAPPVRTAAPSRTEALAVTPAPTEATKPPDSSLPALPLDSSSVLFAIAVGGSIALSCFIVAMLVQRKRRRSRRLREGSASKGRLYNLETTSATHLAIHSPAQGRRDLLARAAFLQERAVTFNFRHHQDGDSISSSISSSSGSNASDLHRGGRARELDEQV